MGMWYFGDDINGIYLTTLCILRGHNYKFGGMYHFSLNLSLCIYGLLRMFIE